MDTSEIEVKAQATDTRSSRGATRPERRVNRRCKITQWMRLQPSDPEKSHFDDLRGSENVSRTGAYFHTTEQSYEIGMRLFLTMPYSQNPVAMNHEYLAEVVRKEPLNNGMDGIGVKILLEMGTHQGYSFSPPRQSR